MSKPSRIVCTRLKPSFESSTRISTSMTLNSISMRRSRCWLPTKRKDNRSSHSSHSSSSSSNRNHRYNHHSLRKLLPIHRLPCSQPQVPRVRRNQCWRPWSIAPAVWIWTTRDTGIITDIPRASSFFDACASNLAPLIFKRPRCALARCRTWTVRDR